MLVYFTILIHKSERKQCGCLLFFVVSTCLDACDPWHSELSVKNEDDIGWSVLQSPPRESNSRTLTCGGFTEFLFRQVLLDGDDAEIHCPYALVTDGHTSCIIRYDGQRISSRVSLCYLYTIIAENVPVRLMIAGIMFASARTIKLLRRLPSAGPIFRPVLGAKNNGKTVYNATEPSADS